MRGAFDLRTPVTVVTGFLGSGKSTFINRLLKNQLLQDVAFVVNEFGEIPIDHLLIDTPRERIAVLPSGCLCCAVGGELEQTLQSLFMRRVRELIPRFRSVVIETSGMASPAPVLETLVSRPLREMNYHFAGVVTMVDAVNASATLEAQPEAQDQVAVADLLALTKSDVAEPCARGGAIDAAERINASAQVLAVDTIISEPSILGDLGLLDVPSLVDGKPDTPLWVRREGELSEGMRAVRHGGPVSSIAVRIAGPVVWNDLNDRLRALLQRHGGRILRLKGIVRVEGVDRPIALQGVRHQLYPPELLPVDSIAGETGALVVIGRDLPAEDIASLLASLQAAPDGHAEIRADGDLLQ